jgi:hypothetical protein
MKQNCSFFGLLMNVSLGACFIGFDWDLIVGRTFTFSMHMLGASDSSTFVSSKAKLLLGEQCFRKSIVSCLLRGTEMRLFVTLMSALILNCY